MKETTKRIETYKAALPGLKERLAAVALLLVVSMIMMISSTFAWVTLSRSPEVNGLSTSISGNGNLEIALSKPDGSAPDEYDVDESVSKGTNVAASNLQWGNLINLSHSSYGIQNMVLRPAQLNTTGLLNNPLWGAQYGSDGRIESLSSDFAFVNYDGKQFGIDSSGYKYGVRAIASYKADVSDVTTEKLNSMIAEASAAHTNTNQAYQVVRAKFAGLGDIVSTYAQDVVNEKLDGNPSNSDLAKYLVNVVALYETLYEAMLTQKDTYVALANLQLFVAANNSGLTYKAVEWEEIERNASVYNNTLNGLTQYISDLKQLKRDLDAINKRYQDFKTSGTPCYWDDISGQINNLVSIYTMKIDLKNDGNKTYLVQLSTDQVPAILGASGKERKVYVDQGIMARFEQIAVDESYRLNGEAECTVKLKITAISLTIYGKAYTEVTGACYFAQDMSKAQGEKLVPKDAVAEDTYGMAVDFWVRTNAESTLLVLEGAFATDSTGALIRYDGVNRVWGYTSESGLPGMESTSQGGGSSYTYYADTPEDMARSLNLLDAMKVAFISEDGKLLATAEMDTENYCAVNGRVTVPMVLDDNTTLSYVEVDSNGVEKNIRAISELTYDSAQRITAIIYLDGANLSNDDVLAASDIQGQLNIQFGSSQDLQTIGDDTLLNSQWSVEASLEDGSSSVSFKYEEKDAIPLITKLMLNINGAEPSEVKAFFVRSITSTQGAREEEMTFTKLADGKWTAEYEFSAPGTYYLRDVQLNGINYNLSQPIKVEITGFALTGVTWSENGEDVVYRTSDGTHATDVTVSFAKSEQYQMPHAVQARFVRTDGNTVNVTLSYDGGGDWKGTAIFNTSGKYTLEYLVYTVKDDTTGESKNVYYALGNKAKTIDLSLGLYVVVTNQSGQETVDYDSAKTYEWDVVVGIFDNTGNRLENMENVRLVYSNNGSVSNTVKVELTPEFDQYMGTLAIHSAGRWMFGYLEMDGQILTKATSSPLFTIISPDPVKFNAASVSSYFGKTQYKPLTNDAIIDGIKIANSDAATIEAIVYNSISKKYERVTWDKVSHVNDKVSIKLPQYTLDLDADGRPLENATYSQEGTWELVALILTNCYAEDKQFHDETNPVVWANQGHKAYFDSQAEQENAIVVTEYLDLSRMTTKVSSALNVSMVSGNTALGGADAEFMKQFALKDIGMQVVLTDAEGNQIPASEVVANVTLNISYVPPTTSSAYGYKVQGGAGKNYAIKLTNINAENGTYVVSDGSSVWQYVGEYMVKNLSVTIGGQTLTLTPDGSNGVPTKYTVTTQTYDAGDITPIDIKQGNTVFGKTGDNITGTFLLSYNLEQFNIQFKLNAQAVDGTQYVVLEDNDVTAQLELTHTGGSNQNGGYSFTDSEYTNITIPMSNSNGLYRASSSVLLAGNYNAQIRYTIAGTEKVETLKSISVYSKKPDVTMALSGDTASTVTAVTGGGIWYQDTFTANNTISNNGHSAMLFASAERSTEVGSHTGGGFLGIGSHTTYDTSNSGKYADYTLPSLKFSLTNGGTTCSDFTLLIPNNGTNAMFTSGNATSTVTIGSIMSNSHKQSAYCTECGENKDYTYATKSANAIGTQVISTITAVYGNGTFTITLDSPLSIVNENKAAPSVDFDMTENPGFVKPTGMSSSDGYKFTFTLPSELKTNTGASFVAQSREEHVSSLESSSGDLADLLPNMESIADTDWLDVAGTSTIKNIYTETYKIEKDTHHHSLFIWKNHWYKHYEQTKYDVKNVQQTVSYTVRAEGTITTINTTYAYEDTIMLEAWLVDGVRYAPGAQVEITGNSIIMPVYRTTSKLVKKTVETSTTVGTFSANYSTTCKAVITTQNGNVITGNLTNYCVQSGSCNEKYPTMGSEAAAKAAAEADAIPNVEGYTKTSEAVTAGTNRDFSESKWVQDGDAIMDGETTTTTVVYDGEGNVIG